MKKSKNITTIICKSCGAHFDEMLPKCPYCGEASIKGAEAEYMNKLEEVRSDMEDLGEVPEAETIKEFKKQGKFFIKVLLTMSIIIGGILLFSYLTSRTDTGNRQNDYAWQQENMPILDELYEQENYEQLLALYREASEQEAPIYTWEHWEFCAALQDFLYVEEILEAEKAGKSLTEWEYTDLLYYGFKAKLLLHDISYSEEEKQRLLPYTQNILNDFETRWNFTKEEMDTFEKEMDKHLGFVPYKSCKTYVKKWMKRSSK